MFNIDVVERNVDLGMRTSFAAWTNGRIPAPTLEVCEVDQVTITVTNKGNDGTRPRHTRNEDRRASLRSRDPGKAMTILRSVDTPGVFMYHCASGPVTDLHIKSGIHGAMIVYPEQLRPAREIVVVEDAVFGTRDSEGFIPGTDPRKGSEE